MKKVSLILCSVLIIVGCGSKEENEKNGKNNNPEDKKLESNQVGSNSELKNDEVIIGSQVWMTKNLDVATFRNGDPIPEVKTAEEWKKAGEEGKPAWCYYENDQKNGEKYGKLYNWYAVNDSRGLAPAGYHIPSDAEWTVLTDYLGGEDVAGTKMKSKSGWNNKGNGTNESGFSGLSGGSRQGVGLFYGLFYYVGGFGGWWSSSEYNTGFAWFRGLVYEYGSVLRGSYGNEEDGFSVRCLRD